MLKTLSNGGMSLLAGSCHPLLARLRRRGLAAPSFVRRSMHVASLSAITQDARDQRHINSDERYFYRHERGSAYAVSSQRRSPRAGRDKLGPAARFLPGGHKGPGVGGGPP